MAAGHLLDLSEGGCAVLFKNRVEANLAARMQLEVEGKELWLPVVTRWARRDSQGWTVGCQFDRPTEEKQQAIRALVAERRNLVAS